MPINNQTLNANSILKQHGLHAEKSLGQNFLQNRASLELIVDSAEIQKTDTVLEIGPGLGSLTQFLAHAAKSVISVELDHDLIPVLKSVLASFQNIRLIEGDILKITPSSVIDTDDYLVVANVPYYITSAIFRHLLSNKPRPRRIVLTIQKEVAERICANAGDMSLLALSIQVYGKPRIMGIIPADDFYPQPKVDSAILRVDLNPESFIQEKYMSDFFLLAKAGFSQKRKTLRNSLSAGLRMSSQEAASLLEHSGIDPMRRAETLDLTEWTTLTLKFSDLVNVSKL